MSTKKAIALAGLFLLLTVGLALSQEQSQATEVNRVKAKAQAQVKTRTMFMDQNGDGINDFYRDHDNDGIPNCQDPDWQRPEDGSGYKNRLGQGGPQKMDQSRAGFRSGHSWSNASFRNGLKGFGSGICDGTGPKGKTGRKGRR